MLLDILQIVAGIGTVLTGLLSLFRPQAVEGFTGLKPTGARGVTEIRAVLGAFFRRSGRCRAFPPRSGGLSDARDRVSVRCGGAHCIHVRGQISSLLEYHQHSL